ncbi:hypothetical protein EJD97_006866, partial [Solanum chilense]
RSKKISQPLKCRRLKKSISQTLYVISEKKEKEKKAKEKKEKEEQEKEKKEKKAKQEKEKEKENKKKAKEMEKEKEKNKEKKVEVVSCDVKRQYPFEVFNIDNEGPTELMSSFSQWINEGLYKHHAKK